VETNPHGPEIRADGSVRFRLWAPACDRVELLLCGEPAPLAMDRATDGWHEWIAKRARPGTRYRFRLPDGLEVPDPASRYQPEDVHGPSEIVDTASWHWSGTAWHGRPWREAVMYELHLGAFTREGTFRSAIGKLDHLVELGVTAIEIMPIADFPGRRNWGYDGVLPYAPDSSYGRPEDFKALIEAAHARGIMVILDVVYNHFGPNGNYLHAYAPAFFTDRHKTPWGAGINFDGSESRPVRDFFTHNALYWLREYRLDGLRLDAVHAIVDESPTHILREIAERVRVAFPGRHVHLILENEDNQSRWLRPGLYTAQWNDDVHHVLHTAITGENQGYYVAYRGDTARLGRALAEGFAYQGEMMKYRGRPRGEPSGHLPPDAFIAFLQNHDQIGNRAFGERIGALAPPEAVRAAAAVYLLLPQIPMLFMGEEWNARSPFPFFCDFGPDLADKVREGRRAEFARFPEFQDPVQRERIPDPQADATFGSARVDWEQSRRAVHAEWLDWYRRILACRRQRILPLLDCIAPGRFEVIAPGAVVVRWGALTLIANLSPEPCAGLPIPSTVPIWQEGEPGGPWSVAWFTQVARASALPCPDSPGHSSHVPPHALECPEESGDSRPEARAIS
jgi:malto-oligosyltrehalose trehalohydrolase